MRTTQFFGLSAQANQWLANNCKHETLVTCPCCGAKKGGNLTSFGLPAPGELGKSFQKVIGMFQEEVHTLQIYELSNGKGYVEEYIQAEPWSSGPCIFLALKFSNTGEVVKKSLWEQETIDNC